MEAVTGNIDRTLSLPILSGASKVVQCKESPTSAGDARDRGSIPGLGRFSGGGNGNPLQHSCLENPRDGRARWSLVHGVEQSWTRLSD